MNQLSLGMHSRKEFSVKKSIFSLVVIILISFSVVLSLIAFDLLCSFVVKTNVRVCLCIKSEGGWYRCIYRECTQ